MKVKKIATTLILAISLPVIADITLSGKAIAGLPFPDGQFGDYNPQLSVYDSQNRPKTTIFSLLVEKNTYYLHTRNLKTNQTFCVGGATVTGTPQRPVFTWSSRGSKYQIAWQPKENDTIRLIVTNPAGKVVTSQLLKRMPGEFAEPEEFKCAGKIIRS
ncbi:MAG TPA: hypothetical protein VK203_11600 [Nostocaceae cyanobacterium]|nr:hypothetical protein [Nostocaceae cyanobacterium]